MAERQGGRFISLRRKITYEEEKMAYDAALWLVPKKPYTMMRMRTSRVYTGFCLVRLWFPLPFFLISKSL